jgi:5-methylcytosine-specific restriction endonuclease McrA
MKRRFATKTQRTNLYILQDGLCAICQSSLEDSFEVDHIQPFSEKGVTEIWNLQALCKSCHLEKTLAKASKQYLTKYKKDPSI